jgi:hypothetical protein
MMQRSAPPTFPEALDDDDDDVTWALQTAAVQWKRGAHSDAVEWLRRAAESAVDGGRVTRARDLTQRTNAIEAALRTGWVPRLTPSGHPAESSGSLRAPASSRSYGSSGPSSSSQPPASARPFPLRTPRPPANPFSSPPRADNPFVGPPAAANPFASSPAINPFSSGRASSRPPANAHRNVAHDDGVEAIEPDTYSELAVDIEVAPESVAPRSRRDVSQATELSDDELVEELNEVDDFDEADVAALSAARRPIARAPFLSAPELTTGPAVEADFDLETADYAEEDEDDEDRPTLPPSSDNKDRPIVVPSSLRDEIDELLGKPVRRSSRAAPAPTPPPTAASAPPARELNRRERVIRERVAREPAALGSEAPRAAAAAQRRIEAARAEEPLLQEEEEPTERSLEAAPELDAPFSEQPPEETTERDLEAERAMDPVPSSRKREKATDSEPGTSPDLQVPFSSSDSTPPTEPSRDATPASASSKQAPPISEPAPVISEPAAALSEPTIVFTEPPPAQSDPPIILSDIPPAFSDPPIILSDIPAVSEPPILLSDIPAGFTDPPAFSDPPIVLSDIPPLGFSDPPIILSQLPIDFSDPPAPAPSAPPALIAPAAPSSPPAQALSQPVASEPRPTEPAGPAEISGILLSEVRGLEDLPDESQAQLVEGAEIHTLAANEEVAGFGLALVLDGAVAVMAEVADVAAAQARRGELVFSQGHLEDGIRMRIVASVNGAQVATWPYQAFSAAITACPWVGDELKNVGDRFQALAGVAMGPMGDQLDDMLRALVVERCEVKRLLPGEIIAHGGKTVPGMVIVGAGRLEVVQGEGLTARVLEELHPGDFLFAPQILQASPAPGTARAGKGGALVLFAERKIAHELLVGVPPLLGIFAC